MEKSILKVSSLNKSFGKFKAISDINLNVFEGDIYGFLGPNGSGKTTTIRSILGLLNIDSGSIEICGHDIHTNFEAAMKNIGAVVENPTLYPYLSGRKNLEMYADIQGLSKSRVDEVLKIVNLENRAQDKVRKYSLGMKQRLGIAQALLAKPKLIILDEPTNGLDPHGMVEIRQLIKNLAVEEKITFFISSHLLNEVEQLCNRVSILKSGRVITEGYVEDLLTSTDETIKLDVNDMVLAQDILNELDFIVSVKAEGKHLILTASKGMVSQINSALSQKGVLINSIAPIPKTLESFFMDTIGKGDNIA